MTAYPNNYLCPSICLMTSKKTRLIAKHIGCAEIISICSADVLELLMDRVGGNLSADRFEACVSACGQIMGALRPHNPILTCQELSKCLSTPLGIIYTFIKEYRTAHPFKSNLAAVITNNAWPAHWGAWTRLRWQLRKGETMKPMAWRLQRPTAPSVEMPDLSTMRLGETKTDTVAGPTTTTTTTCDCVEMNQYTDALSQSAARAIIATLDPAYIRQTPS